MFHKLCVTRTSKISYEIGKRAGEKYQIYITGEFDYGQEVVKELVQNQLNTEILVDELQKILEGPKREQNA